MKDLKRTARLSGLIYLLIIITGLFSQVLVREQIIDWGNASLTISNLEAGVFNFRLSFMSDVLMVIFDVMIAVLFYYLLKETNERLAKFAMMFRLIQAAIIAVNMLNQFIPIMIVENPELLGFGLEEKTGIIMMFLNAHNIGYLLSGVFFGISCLYLGQLFRKSDYLPSILAYFLFFGGASYIHVALANFVFTDYIEITEMMVMISAVFSEVSVCFYLLIKGIKKD